MLDNFDTVQNLIDAVNLLTNKIEQLENQIDGVGNGSISTAKIANGAVTESKIADGAVTENKIADGAVTESKIANSAVTESKIADHSVSINKLAADLYTDLNSKATTTSFGLVQLATDNESINMNSSKVVTTSNLNPFVNYYGLLGELQSSRLYNGDLDLLFTSGVWYFNNAAHSFVENTPGFVNVVRIGGKFYQHIVLDTGHEGNRVYNNGIWSDWKFPAVPIPPNTVPLIPITVSGNLDTYKTLGYYSFSTADNIVNAPPTLGLDTSFELQVTRGYDGVGHFIQIVKNIDADTSFIRFTYYTGTWRDWFRIPPITTFITRSNDFLDADYDAIQTNGVYLITANNIDAVVLIVQSSVEMQATVQIKISIDYSDPYFTTIRRIPSPFVDTLRTYIPQPKLDNLVSYYQKLKMDIMIESDYSYYVNLITSNNTSKYKLAELINKHLPPYAYYANSPSTPELITISDNTIILGGIYIETSGFITNDILTIEYFRSTYSDFGNTNFTGRPVITLATHSGFYLYKNGNFIAYHGSLTSLFQNAEFDQYDNFDIISTHKTPAFSPVYTDGYYNNTYHPGLIQPHNNYTNDTGSYRFYIDYVLNFTNGNIVSSITNNTVIHIDPNFQIISEIIALENAIILKPILPLRYTDLYKVATSGAYIFRSSDLVTNIPTGLNDLTSPYMLLVSTHKIFEIPYIVQNVFQIYANGISTIYGRNIKQSDYVLDKPYPSWIDINS